MQIRLPPRWAAVLTLAWGVVSLTHVASIAVAQDRPTLSVIPPLSTAEDVPLLDIPFTVSDPKAPPDQLVVSATGETGLSVTVGGSGKERFLSVFPSQDWNGSRFVTFTVRNPRGQQATQAVQITVRPVADPPRFGPIADHVTGESPGTTLISIPVVDPDAPRARLVLRAWSPQTNLLPASAFRVTGTATNYTLELTPATGATGSAVVWVEAAKPDSTNQVGFVFTAQPAMFERVQHASLPSGFNVADVDADGYLDLHGSAPGFHTVKLNDRHGGFETQAVLLPGNPYGGAWGDADADGDLDLLLYGYSKMELLQNLVERGQGVSFAEVALAAAGILNFTSVTNAFWADLDADGDLDLAMAAGPFSSPTTRLARNEGGWSLDGRSFVISPAVFAFGGGDYDNNGYPDLLVFDGKLRVLANRSGVSFTDTGLVLPHSLTRIDRAGWIDADSDGWLDIWLLGASATKLASLAVLKQEAGTFRRYFEMPPEGMVFGVPPAWADFDLNGRMDFIGPGLLDAGTPPSVRVPRVFLDDFGRGFHAFSLAATGAHDSPGFRCLAGDLNRDGRVDLLPSYRSAGQSFIWWNRGPKANPLPTRPRNLRGYRVGSAILLSWDEAVDGNQTAPLTYNVRVGTAPGLGDVMPAMSTADGTRMVVAPGNVGPRLWARLELGERQPVPLFWTVQAVDNSFLGGPFAPEQALPVQEFVNRPPVLGAIGPQRLRTNDTLEVQFAVEDDATPFAELEVSAAADNVILFREWWLPIRFVPDPTTPSRERSIRLVPTADRSGTTEVTVMAVDRGGLVASQTFTVTVEPGPAVPPLTLESFLGPDTIGLRLRGMPSSQWQVEVSEDLVHWRPEPGSPVVGDLSGLVTAELPRTGPVGFYRFRLVALE